MTLLNYTDPVPLPAPLTSGTTIQSYTDPTGLVWVAKNGVNGGAWKRATDVLHSTVYRGAGFSTAATNTPIAFDTVIKDDYGLYVSPTFTAPVAGWYRVNGQYACTTAAAGNTVNIYIGTGIDAYQSVTAVGATAATWARTQASLYLSAGGTANISLQTTAIYTGYVANRSTYASFDYMGSG